MRTIVCVVMLVFFTMFGTLNAKILFIDDFEKDDIGKEPSQWEHLNFNSGNSKIFVEKDPTDLGSTFRKLMEEKNGGITFGTLTGCGKMTVLSARSTEWKVGLKELNLIFMAAVAPVDRIFRFIHAKRVLGGWLEPDSFPMRTMYGIPIGWL